MCQSSSLDFSRNLSGYRSSNLPPILEEDEESLYVQNSLNECYNRIQLLWDDALFLENLLLPTKPKHRLKRSADCLLEHTQFHFSYTNSFEHLNDSTFAYFHISQFSDSWSLQLYKQFSSFSSSHINLMISYLQNRLQVIRRILSSSLHTSLSEEQEALSSIVLEYISQVSACISRIWRLYLGRTEKSELSLVQSGVENERLVFSRVSSEEIEIGSERNLLEWFYL